ncbi:hypothetical protein H5410_056375 [Solanum commersonii]|uniref:Uncharacterized protein n=1 Tax=Solanum commersonii TaxID=4109 RepID=A0A9J5WK30_SOLCO|nr:hypothetical protein H5410_056375 [Solanum commersonii]
MDIIADGSTPILKINVIASSPIEPTDSFNDNNSVENENLDDQPKESFCDQSNETLGDNSMNRHDHSTDHHCANFLYLYYNAAKAYSLEEFNHYFVEFKDNSPEAAFILEHEIGFEKWSRAQFPDNKYDVMTTNIAKSLNTMLVDERECPMTSIFNSIAKRFGELFKEKHAYVLQSKAETYLLAYSEYINVIPIESEWCVPEEFLRVNILPPLVDTKLGRKKKRCVKGVVETFKSKRRNKCSICNRSGHKRTTCMKNNKS